MSEGTFRRPESGRIYQRKNNDHAVCVSTGCFQPWTVQVEPFLFRERSKEGLGLGTEIGGFGDFHSLFRKGKDAETLPKELRIFGEASGGCKDLCPGVLQHGADFFALKLPDARKDDQGVLLHIHAVVISLHINQRVEGNMCFLQHAEDAAEFLGIPKAIGGHRLKEEDFGSW